MNNKKLKILPHAAFGRRALSMIGFFEGFDPLPPLFAQLLQLSFDQGFIPKEVGLNNDECRLSAICVRDKIIHQNLRKIAESIW